MSHIIIPARYHSTRLPGKPLVDIGGVPMILRVYERAQQVGAQSVVVATDDERIASVLRAVGAEVFVSDVDHQSGTERLAEVVAAGTYSDDDIIVNLQGDEPFIPVELLQQVATTLQQSNDAAMSTLYVPFEQAVDVFNPNIVKVVLDERDYALYFSRAPIPWLRDQFHDIQTISEFDALPFRRHIGIYAYRASFVKQYGALMESPLEKYECLEQLRVLWHGYKIALAAAVTLPGQEVNTPEDLIRAQEFCYAIEK